MDKTILQFRTISALRFPLAVLVVFIHSKVTDAYLTPTWTDFHPADIFLTVQILISNVIGHVAVPTFYVISGYLFFYNLNGFNTETYISKLKKRFHSIMIPYLLWNAMMIGWVLVCKLAGVVVKGKTLSGIADWLAENGWWHLFWDCYMWSLTKCNMLGVNTPSSAPVLVPLWFLRDLMVVIVLTPLIYAALRKLKSWSIVLLGLCYITGIFPYIHGLSVLAVFFFSFGAYFSINQKNMVEQLLKVRVWSYVLAIALIVLMVIFNSQYTPVGSYIYPFYIIVGVVAIINLAAQLIKKGCKVERPSFTKATFFIYAAHGLFGLGIAKAILVRIIPMSETYWPCTLLFYLLMPAVTITICLAVNSLMQHYCPKVLNILTGSRELFTKK